MIKVRQSRVLGAAAAADGMAPIAERQGAFPAELKGSLAIAQLLEALHR